MKRIGILGANGQVGLELCLLLSRFEGIEVIALCRNSVGSAVCRRLGITVRHYDVDDQAALKLAFEGLDMLVDMTLPLGSAAEQRKSIGHFLHSIFAAIGENTSFVYVGSVSADALTNDTVVPKLFWPRSPYAAAKRYGERIAGKLAVARRRKFTILRLGQVHGRMQTVSIDLLSTRPPAMAEPGPPTCVVFCRTIAEALVALVEGRERHGRYALLSEPRWRLDEVASFYATGNVPARQPAPPSDIAVAGRASWLRGLFRSLLAAAKPIATSVILARMPKLEARLATRWRYSVATAEIAALPNASSWWTKRIILGTPSGLVMKTLPDIRSDPFGPEPPRY
jgi:nucleoside-diphosphate-sugar epimerase